MGYVYSRKYAFRRSVFFLLITYALIGEKSPSQPPFHLQLKEHTSHEAISQKYCTIRLTRVDTCAGRRASTRVTRHGAQNEQFVIKYLIST